MNHKQSPFNNPGRGNPGQRQRHASGQRQSQARESIWKQNFKTEWISHALDDKAIAFAEQFGEDLTSKVKKEKERLTTNQIRNFFGEVRRIQLKGVLAEKTAFLLLRPKLAYAAKRADNPSAEDFKQVMEQAHIVVMQAENNDAEFEKRFKNYIDFLEAILAYHKAYGGK
jgi:CRISPR-associated protein Csm2